jgi:transposase
MPKIMGRKEKEMSPDIARVLQQPRSTISYIIRRFREAGTVEHRPRSERLRAVDDRDYRQLEKIVKTERRAPLIEITAKFNEERNVSVSKWTVRRRLRDHGFSKRVCRKRVVVKFDNRKKKRLAWCREKRWWTTQYQWSKIIFSDESQVCIGKD